MQLQLGDDGQGHGRGPFAAEIEAHRRAQPLEGQPGGPSREEEAAERELVEDAAADIVVSRGVWRTSEAALAARRLEEERAASAAAASPAEGAAAGAASGGGLRLRGTPAWLQ